MPKRNSIRIVLAENLRALRQQKGLSQEKLAELAGLHRTYVGSAERGERNISIDNIDALAGALEINVSDVLSTKRLR